MQEEQLILVNEQDEILGTMGKMEAHRAGILHRAFSIFIFNDAGELLLQQRSATKYHSAGLWTNTCCSHPRFGEDMKLELQKRLMQEMGFNCPLQKAFNYLYKVDMGNGLIEHELDHIYTGLWNGSPLINPDEAQDWRWITPAALKTELAAGPENFTYWFREIAGKVIEGCTSL
jgi:isopentenyl-diphosphate delta-isomerase